MVEKFEQQAAADPPNKAVVFDASHLQRGACGACGNDQQQEQFNKILGDLGLHPKVDKLAKVFPQLHDGVEILYKAAADMQPPEQSVPTQWQLNDLHDPAWKLARDVNKDPGKLGLTGAEEAKVVIRDYAEGRKSDGYGTVITELDKLNGQDPRVGEAKSAIDKILSGPYKSAYDDYRTKYIPFTDSKYAATEKAMKMQYRVEDRIFGATGATTEATRQQVVDMRRQIRQLDDQYVMNRY